MLIETLLGLDDTKNFLVDVQTVGILYLSLVLDNANIEQCMLAC